MAYNEFGVVNLALSRLGIARITSADWTTPATVQALDANAVYEYIRDEVLEARDWRFAKTRCQLEQRYETPIFGFDYAYSLPDNFLRFPLMNDEDMSVYPSDPVFNASTINYYHTPVNNPAMTRLYPHRIETIPFPTGAEKVTNGAFTGAATSWTLGTGWAYGTNNVAKTAGAGTMSQAYTSMVSAPAVGEKYKLTFYLSAISGGSLIPKVGSHTGTPVSTIGTKTQYFIATSATDGITFTPSATALTCTIDDVTLFLVSDKKCLITSYDDTDDELYINYIAKITDVTQYPPSFINALSWRLAAELAIPRKESSMSFKDCMIMYEEALTRADSINQSFDSINNEMGDTSWVDAGRGQ